MASADTSLDGILVEMGDFGKYQMVVLGIIGVAVMLDSAISVAFVFTSMNLDYRCEVPECDRGHPIKSGFDPPWLENAVPFTGKGVPSNCERFALSSNETEVNCFLASGFDPGTKDKCDSFVYKTEQVSILREYGLHCDDNLWKLTLVGTIGSAGQFFGMFTCGLISDKYGRRFALILGMVLCGIIGIIQTFAPTYVWFQVFEFFKAFCAAGVYACMFIMGVELVGPKKRPLVGIIITSLYALGEVWAAGAAWLVLSWKPIIYILYGPPIILVTYFWLIPESVRWYLSKGRCEEAKEVLRRAAKFNNKEVSEISLEKLAVANEKVDLEEQSLREVFKCARLSLRFLQCCFCWITCAFLFYGLTLNSVALVGNRYMNFMLTSFVEIPANVVNAYVMNRLGRKWALTGSFALAGLSCLVFVFVSEDTWAILIYLLGKFGVSAAFTSTYVVTTELFPTPLRHSLMGACSTIGRIGSIVAPQTPLLAKLWEPLPLILFSAMALIAAILSWLFPETLNIKLPNTIEEALSIGREKGSSNDSKTEKS